MSTDPTAPIAKLPGGIWLQRTIGVLAMAAGLAIGFLFSYVTYKISAGNGELETSMLVVPLILALLAAFLSSSGLRMLLNRPNAHGSLFSPAIWYATAAVFILGGTFLVARVLATDQPSIALKPVLYAFFFGALSAWAGWRARRRARRG